MGGDSDPVAFDPGSPKVRHPSTGGKNSSTEKNLFEAVVLLDLYKSFAYVSGETRNAHGYPKPEPQKRFEAAPITSRVCRRCRDFGSRPTSTRAIWQVASWAWTTPRKRSAVGCLRRTAANFRGSVERGPSACGGLAVLPKVHPEPVIGVSLAEIAEIPLECTPWVKQQNCGQRGVSPRAGGSPQETVRPFAVSFSGCTPWRGTSGVAEIAENKFYVARSAPRG